MVVQLELDIRQWQEEQHCARLPTADEDSVLHRRIANYCNKEKSARCRLMRAAYPADVESIQELKLDCLEASDDGDGCVKWRSDVERQMMQSISGWREGNVVKSCFVPLDAVLFAVARLLSMWTWTATQPWLRRCHTPRWPKKSLRC